MNFVQSVASLMTMTIVADTNVIIAAALSVHPFHDRAARAVASALRSRALVMVQHALLESYSVLTRGPAPLRHLPEAAFQLLHVTYAACEIIPAAVDDVRQFLSERDLRTSGGALYDALIATIAIGAGVQQLLTFNAKHFEAFAGQIEIVVPA